MDGESTSLILVILRVHVSQSSDRGNDEKITVRHDSIYVNPNKLSDLFGLYYLHLYTPNSKRQDELNAPFFSRVLPFWSRRE